MDYQWNIKKPLASNGVEEREVQDIIEILLENRGIIQHADRQRFLNPDWDEHIHSPWDFSQMKQAVDTTFAAMKNGKTIMIHGDYDADGVSGSAILYTVLRELREKFGFDFPIGVFLPDREADGYGVAMHTVKRFVRRGVDLLITVDCGISNAHELDYATENEMDVIVCDHHQLGKRLPDKAMIIHPLAPGETYQNKHLCGTGVAFKFATALIEEAQKRGADFPVGHEKWLLDLVAIATVTDVMPLIGENRLLEKYGLLVLNKTRRPGVRQIVQFARSQLGNLDTQSIGFQIGPRLNAAGRIQSAKLAFETLVAQTSEEAEHFAAQLEQLNRERQRISRNAYKQAEAMLADQKSDSIYIVWSDHWHPGIVGLIAGKIASSKNKPAFAITKSGDHYVGSGRSAGGLNLVELMHDCGDIFLKAGGHPEACGLSIQEEKLSTFKEKANKIVQEKLQGSHLHPQLDIDTELQVRDVNWDLIEVILKLAPYGQGNPRPVFVVKNAAIEQVSAVGQDGKHLRMQLQRNHARPLNAIGFNLGDRLPEVREGMSVDIACEVNVNEWNGNKSVQLIMLDFKTS